MEKNIAVVDGAERFVRWTDREEVHTRQLLHRSIYVALFDSSGALILQRRHPEKRTHPDHWDMSCSGHVEREDYPGFPDARLNEVYAVVASRELAEVLGVSVPLRELGHFGPQPGIHYEYFRFYTGTSDGPFKLQEDEVSAVQAVPFSDIDGFLRDADAVTPVLGWLVDWLTCHH
jgi:isopentenyldiphosphate isomerase